MEDRLTELEVVDPIESPFTNEDDEYSSVPTESEFVIPLHQEMQDFQKFLLKIWDFVDDLSLMYRRVSLIPTKTIRGNSSKRSYEKEDSVNTIEKKIRKMIGRARTYLASSKKEMNESARKRNNWNQQLLTDASYHPCVEHRIRKVCYFDCLEKFSVILREYSKAKIQRRDVLISQVKDIIHSRPKKIKERKDPKSIGSREFQVKKIRPKKKTRQRIRFEDFSSSTTSEDEWEENLRKKNRRSKHYKRSKKERKRNREEGYEEGNIVVLYASHEEEGTDQEEEDNILTEKLVDQYYENPRSLFLQSLNMTSAVKTVSVEREISVETRNELMDIHNEMNEVIDMLQDCRCILDQQDTFIERIEDSVFETFVHVSEGRKYIQKSKKVKKKSWGLCAVAIITAIIFFILSILLVIGTGITITGLASIYLP